MVIKWSDFSKENIKDFTKNSLMLSPKNYVKSLLEYVTYLSDHPRLGKVLCYINSKEIRQLIYRKHRILYYIFDNKIYIIAVIHSSQDLKTSLKFIKRFFK